MPRNPGTGQYTKPIPAAVANTTIASAPYNLNVDDVVIDLNAPRPIVAGGTGAVNAHDARVNIGAEVSSLNQVVTNYDSQVWESGSFASLIGATGAPTSAEHFMGVAILLDGSQNYITLRAIGNTTGKTYTRLKQGGVWAAWTAQTDVLNAKADKTYVDAQDALKVAKAGDTMTGGLIISMAGPTLTLDKQTGGQSVIVGRLGSSGNRWGMQLGNNIAESGSNAGSDFELSNYSDLAGAYLGSPLIIRRASGAAIFSGVLTTASSVPGSNPGVNNTTVGFCIEKNANGPYIAASRADSSLAHWNLNIDGVMHWMLRFGIAVGNISVSGTTTSYNTSSSADLKEDLKTFSASAIVDATQVWDFKWKSSQERAYGILAQQAKDVYPAAVTYDTEKDWWGIDYSKYVPILLQELKALRVRVAQLEAGIAGKPA
jgi:hypothetical protein